MYEESETGIVKWFDEEKGFGFITRQNNSDMFVHYTGILGQGRRSLLEGQLVSFIVRNSQKTGKPNAEEVEVLA